MRRELREKGRLAPPPKAKQAQRIAERQAEEQAASSRVADARDEVARHERGPARKARAKQRDLTVLILLGLTAIAALLFYLSQRPLRSNDAEAKPNPSASPASQAKEEGAR